MTFRAGVIEQLMMEAAAEGVDNSDIGTVEWLARKLSEARDVMPDEVARMLRGERPFDT